jgi:hypothetical protein
MKYAVEMGSDATIYIPSFIKIGLGIQKLMRVRGLHRHRETARLSHKPTYFHLFKVREVENVTIQTQDWYLKFPPTPNRLHFCMWD